MNTRILITGSSGFLGSRLALHLKNKYDLLLPTHDNLNISHEEAVKTYMSEHRPDIVIHCAALSNTWYCEQHPDESHRVNVQGTVRIAKACKLVDAKLIFMSSDQVYNGTPLLGALKEDVLQPVSLAIGTLGLPKNIYGQHKLEAEQRALRNNPDSVGLRLTWMYDLPNSRLKLNSNILVNLQKAYTDGTIIKPAINEYRGVTYVWEVVKNMEKAITLPGGIYNFGCSNMLNSYELHQQVANIMGLQGSQDWILPDNERFSEQERNLVMDCSLIAQHGIHFADSIDGVKEAILRPFRVNN